jgi:UDP-glucose 4-epimerase
LEKVVKKTVLVTGGLGCIGIRLCQYLLNLEFKVIIGSSRKDAVLPNNFIGCSLIYTDFSSADTLVNACHDVNYVIHLATVNAQQSQDNPQLALRVNGIGTLNLIQASIVNKVQYFLYFSTAHVYGSPLVGKINENTLTRPVHPYAITHRLSEDFLMGAINSGEIKGAVIRLSNSVGLPLLKGANCWKLFVNDACKQAVIKRRIVIYSNPNNERDFIPIDSVCEIVGHFLNNELSSDFPVYNVGSGSSKSLLQISNMIIVRCQVLFGYSPELVFSNDNKESDVALEYNIDKLKHTIGCMPNNDLNLVIDDVLKFCKAEFR